MKRFSSVRLVFFLALIGGVILGVKLFAQDGPGKEEKPHVVLKFGHESSNPAELYAIDVDCQKLKRAIHDVLKDDKSLYKLRFHKSNNTFSDNLEDCEAAPMTGTTSGAESGSTTRTQQSPSPGPTSGNSIRTQVAQTVSFSSVSDASDFLNALK